MLERNREIKHCRLIWSTSDQIGVEFVERHIGVEERRSTPVEWILGGPLAHRRGSDRLQSRVQFKRSTRIAAIAAGLEELKPPGVACRTASRRRRWGAERACEPNATLVPQHLGLVPPEALPNVSLSCSSV